MTTPMAFRTALLSCVILFSFTIGSEVFAQGILITEEDSLSNPEIVAMRSLLSRDVDGNVVELHEIYFSKEAADYFGWILPIDVYVLTDENDDTEITFEATECDLDLDVVDHMTAPRILYYERAYEGDGCSCEESSPLPEEHPIEDIFPEEEYSEQPVTFDNVTLSELIGEINKLNSTEYVLDDVQTTLVNHFSFHGYRFVYLDVQSSLRSGRVCVQVTYTPPSNWHSEYVVPVRAAYSSTISSVEVTLFSLSNETLVPISDYGYAYYRWTELNRNEIRISEEEGEFSNYPLLFDTAISPDEEGEPPSFVIEFSGQLDEPLLSTTSPDTQWITRLRSRLAKAQLNEKEIYLTKDSQRSVSRDFPLITASDQTQVASMSALAILALVCTIAFRRGGGRKS